MPKDGDISFSSSYDEKIFKETGKIIFNKGMLDVRFNKKVIAIVEDGRLYINIYEQFLPLTRVENIDSMINANSRKALADRRLGILNSLR